MHGDDTPRGTVGNEIAIRDDDQVTIGGYGTSGKTVRLLLEWVFPFGRPVDEVLARVDRERAAQQALAADLGRVIAYARKCERIITTTAELDVTLDQWRDENGVGDLLDREG